MTLAKVSEAQGARALIPGEGVGCQLCNALPIFHSFCLILRDMRTVGEGGGFRESPSERFRKVGLQSRESTAVLHCPFHHTRTWTQAGEFY